MKRYVLNMGAVVLDVENDNEMIAFFVDPHAAEEYIEWMNNTCADCGYRGGMHSYSCPNGTEGWR
jgi:hypothetical protein